MNMADVSQTNLVPLEIIDFENYADRGKSFAPPVEGKYTARVPLINEASFGQTKEGVFSLSVDPLELLEPAANAYKVRFTKLSAKKYANRNGSQVMDFLRGCGIAARPTTNEELKAACKLASGRTVQLQLVWEAYNKDTQESTSGMENFPPDPQNPSVRQPYIVDENDSSKRWFANGRVKYFISAITK